MTREPLKIIEFWEKHLEEYVLAFICAKFKRKVSSSLASITFQSQIVHLIQSLTLINSSKTRPDTRLP